MQACIRAATEAAWHLSERLKDQLLLVLSNAATCVLNSQLHHVHANSSCWQGLDCHPDVALSRELEGISQQVEDDLHGII